MAHPTSMYRAARITGILLLGILAACSPLDQLRRAQEQDSGTFSANLAAEYLAYAESEKELGQDESSTYFAKKGLRASQGHPTPPEEPDAWDIAPGLQMELRNARQRLMRVRSDFFTRVAAQNVARAQLFYDCWVMQATTKSENDLALPCRAQFLSEVQELEQIIDTLGPQPKVTLPAEYTILFPLGSAELTKDAAYTIGEVRAIATLYPLHTIKITGHADRSGSVARNQVLSAERAANVARALVDAGLDAARIGFSARGETEPATPTLDGIRRERNRRVEIIVKPLLPAAPSAETKAGEGSADVP